ncbi:MAG: polyphenol oxidase family protein [Actinomycetia bacterium]|nr:polyphenol oxidase family protein [Actinomycetes bacterium]
MILPPGVGGVVFGTRTLGDGRSDPTARSSVSVELGISKDWATVKQVHGTGVVAVSEPGFYGEADALVTTMIGLPIVIATADCVPVVLLGSTTRAVAHAGWRGVAGGVVPATVDRMQALGDQPTVAILGPHIGSCCYEVGREVIEEVGGFAARTRSGTPSVDLAAAIRCQLPGVEVLDIGRCTHDDPSMASYREDGTSERQVTIVWIPRD